MIDFPNSPTTGQICNSGTGPIYIWDGVAWSLVTQATRTANVRNRLVNPAMQVSQEMGRVQIAASASNTAGYFSADQWRASWSTTSGSLRAGSSATGGPDGQCNSFLNILTAQASLAAGQYGFYRTFVEGLDMADFQWGTANAKQAVLRYSINVHVAGTYCVRVTNGDFTRSYIAAISVPVANVWQDVVVAIPGDTTGTWATDNTLGMSVDFACAFGSNFVGVAGWQAGNFYVTSAQVNGLGTVGQFQIANAALHLDPDKTGLAPPFEIPNIATENVKCARYWEYISGSSVYGYGNAGNFIQETYTFKARKRVTPTMQAPNWGSTSNATSQGVNNVTVDAFTFQAAASATGTFFFQGLTSYANARM